MLIIITHDRNDKLIDQVEWLLGNPKSIHVQGLHGTKLHLIATNRELAWIRANITGIRMHGSNQVRWIGEDAVFIANALPKPEDLENGVWL
ncbi:MAG: hypothetical protein ABWX90_03335 [Candidatus Saccharimonadales bacterium]